MTRAKKKVASNERSKPSVEKKVGTSIEHMIKSTASSSPFNENKPGVTINTHYILFFLMVCVFVGCFTLIRPYIHTILLAMILAFVMSPVHGRIEIALGGRKNTAAAVSCLLLTICVVLPLFFMLFSVIQQAVSSFNAMSDFIAAGKAEALLSHPLVMKVTGIIRHVMPDIKKAFPDLANVRIDKLVMNTSASLGKSLLNKSGSIAGNIGALIANFFLMIFTFFFMVRDESKMLDRLLHLVPMTASEENQIIEKIKDVAKSALLGTLVTALAQGFAGGLAFFFCGLPALFWGMVMAFASLIPMVGTALVWVPACLYLLISGSLWQSLFLLIWCVVVVGGIDNFVRPLFMQGGSGMHTLVIFFSIIGGINTFGLMGLLYGPLLFGLALVLLHIYNLEFREFLTGQDKR